LVKGVFFVTGVFVTGVTEGPTEAEKDHEEPQKDFNKKVTRMFETLETACDVFVRVAENDGNSAIVLVGGGLDARQSKEWKVLSDSSSNEIRKHLNKRDKRLWPIVITAAKGLEETRRDARVGKD